MKNRQGPLPSHDYAYSRAMAESSKIPLVGLGDQKPLIQNGIRPCRFVITIIFKLSWYKYMMIQDLEIIASKNSPKPVLV